MSIIENTITEQFSDPIRVNLNETKMNFYMFRLENETRDLLLSITKNCETFTKQTQTTPRETFEVQLFQPQQFFCFSPPINIGPESNWLVGLPSLEVYNAFLDTTQ